MNFGVNMFYYKVFIWWIDGTNSEFYTNADSCLDAENRILDDFSGTVRDSIASYFSEMVEKD